MIIYKLEDINNTISGMRNNINGILDRGETHLSADIDKFRKEKQIVVNDNNYTESGKQEKANELSLKHLEEIKNQGEKFIQEIEKEYDSAIESINTLVQFDSEAKLVQEDKVDKVKENSDLIYAVQLLNNIDDSQDSGMLKELFEKYQKNEKIMNLVKMKVNKLIKNGVSSSALDEVLKSIKLLDADYVEQLKTEKDKSISYFRENGYPNKTFAHKLERIYEVKIGKSLLDFAK